MSSENDGIVRSRQGNVSRAFSSIRVGWFLGTRQLRRSNKAMSVLIVLVMTLTFLNLVVVTGILVGLPSGANDAYRKHHAGDIIISAPEDKRFIERSQLLHREIDALPEVAATSARYVSGARIVANYKETRAADELPDQISVQIAGIDAAAEDVVTNLGRFMLVGEYLRPGDTDGIIVSSELLAEYTGGTPLTDTTLENVEIGNKLLVTVGENTREFTLRGIFQVKSQVTLQRVFITDSRLREMLGRFDSNVNEIAVRLRPDTEARAVKHAIQRFDTAAGADVELAEEALGQFLSDIQQTMEILGNGIGSIGLVVAAITIFIVIFISAVTRRRHIGILKGIGIGGFAIEFAYVIQALAYVLVGASIGLVLIYQVLVPYFIRNPIDFPISDGILLAPLEETLIRMALLIITTIIAGYVPAKLIVRQNTLDAILGR